MRTHRWNLFSLFLLFFLVSACAKQAPVADYYDEAASGAVREERRSMRAKSSADYDGFAESDMEFAEPMEPAPEEPEANEPAQPRMVYYDGYLQLRVTDPEDSINQLIDVARQAGGYVENRTDTRVTMRVPVEKFDAIYEQFLGMGDVLERSVSAEDVTEAYTAIDLRLKTLKATRDRLVELLARAKTEEEKLALLQQIQRVSEEIDVVEGRLRTLSELANFSRITIETVPRSAFSDRPYMEDSVGIGWIANLSPFRRTAGDDKRIALGVPEEMVVLSRRGRFIAESADGAVMWTARFPNNPRGDADFWIDAVEQRLAPQFASAEVREVGGFRLIRLVEDGGYRYLVGVREAGRWVEVVQVYYPEADHEERYKDGVLKAIGGGQG